MGLYKNYPFLVTLWAFVEVVLFGGVIFGWGSLVYILKEEGFYLDVCESPEATLLADTPGSITYISALTQVNGTYAIAHPPASNATETGTITTNDTVAVINLGCPAQESRLNLWFTIAVSFQYLAFAGIGNMIRVAGLRIMRSVFLVIYLIGTLCLALATPGTPWLLLPGLCCIGSAGLTILATNLQVANLQPRYRSTIVAIFTGLFDFSSINKQIIRIAFEGGIPRRTSYLIYMAACLVLVGISTFFLLPKESVTEKHIHKVEKRRRRTDTRTPTSNGFPERHEVLIKTTAAEKELEGLGVECLESTVSITVKPVTEPIVEEPSLCSTLWSLTFTLHLYWLFVHALRFVTFIGLINVWLENIFHNDETKVGELLGVFSYMTMGAIGTAFLCGTVYDWQRRRYANAPKRQRTYFPVILPMMLVILFSVATTAFCYIRLWISPYLAFAVFTFLRSWLFTVAVAFIGDVFPIAYFGALFGFLQFAAGIAGLLQYPIFEWYKAYDGSNTHVNLLLLILQVSTLIHPVLLWFRARKDKSTELNEPFTAEIVINPEIAITPHCA